MRPPTLHLHKATGVWRIKHRGRHIYFTRDKKESKARYLRWLRTEWVPSVAAPRPTSRRITLVELAEAYLAHVHARRSAALERDYRTYLKFLLLHDDGLGARMRVDEMHPRILQGMADAMRESGYKPRSINHAVKAWQRCYRFGARMGYVEPAIDLSGVEPVPVPPPSPKVPTVAWVHEQVALAAEIDRDLAVWIAVQYLCGMRPSELVRLAYNEGSWRAEGIYAMDSKTGERTGSWRYVVCSEEVVTHWLPRLRKRWRSWQRYSEYHRKALGKGGPRTLRRCCATHLEQAGVSRFRVRQALGHAGRSSTDHYVEADWASLRSDLGRISVPVSLVSTASSPTPPVTPRR